MGTSTNKIALVTGAYRGIGLEAVRQLATKGFRVYLSARNAAKGNAAVKNLQKEGKDVAFLVMDISVASSIKKAAQAFSKKENRLDVLVNNAGIMSSDDKTKTILKTSLKALEETMLTNTWGPVMVTQAFAPLIEKVRGRVINVSSGAGSLSEMHSFAPAYSISKTALNSATRQTANIWKDKGVAVFTMCPGWVRTDMGGPEAPRTVEQGADTITWLATDAPFDGTGLFYRDRKVIAW